MKDFKYSDPLLAFETVAFIGNFPLNLSRKTTLDATHTLYIFHDAKKSSIILSLTVGYISDTWLAIS